MKSKQFELIRFTICKVKITEKHKIKKNNDTTQQNSAKHLGLNKISSHSKINCIFVGIATSEYYNFRNGFIAFNDKSALLRPS